MGMRKKPAVPLTQKFPKAEPLALKLLERLISFDPKDRPSAEEVRTRQPLTLLINYIHASVNVIKLHVIFFPNVHKQLLSLSIQKVPFSFFIPTKKLHTNYVSFSFFHRICEM
jgi:serine/threonine protein kinase